MPYSIQLWTIPVELKCSLVVFLALLGLARTSAPVRITCMSLLTFWSYARSHPDPTLFLAGAILAELYLARQEKPSLIGFGSESKDTEDDSDEPQKQKAKNWALFVLALFFMSYPKVGGKTSLGWGLLGNVGAWLVGDRVPWLLDLFTCSGAILLVYVVSDSASLQRLFSTPLAKYLGKISFALYCVHQPLITWFGYDNMLFWWGITGEESALAFNMGFLIAFCFQTVITIWVADVFCRGVDEPSVRLAKWLEQRFAA